MDLFFDPFHDLHGTQISYKWICGSGLSKIKREQAPSGTKIFQKKQKCHKNKYAINSKGGDLFPAQLFCPDILFIFLCTYLVLQQWIIFWILIFELPKKRTKLYSDIYIWSNVPFPLFLIHHDRRQFIVTHFIYIIIFL